MRYCSARCRKVFAQPKFWCSLILCVLLVNLLYSFYFTESENGERLTVPAESAQEPPPTACSLHKDTRSALARAKTESCKRKIVQVYCSQANSTFLGDHSNGCPYNTKPAPLGCYSDKVGNRLLKNLVEISAANSVNRCIDTCYSVGWEVAGVEYGAECFCGTMEDLRAGQRLNLHRCREYRCPGNGSQLCGGFNAISAYLTGYLNCPEVNLQENRNAQNGMPVKRAKIAFLLQVNGRAARQIKRMLKMIYRQEHIYVVHVDERQDYLYREMLAVQRLAGDNFHVTSRRYPTIWGGSSLLDMIIAVMDELLSLSPKWEYLINLSESDLPIKSVDKLASFLASSNGTNFFSYTTNVSSFIQKQGIDRLFLECEDRMWRLGGRRLPTRVRFQGGSDWYVLHRDFVHFVIRERNSMVDQLREWFRYTLLPVESFFHTVLQNSRFCATSLNHNLRFVNWQRKLGCNCLQRVIDWCGCSPLVFRLGDLQRLRSFAAKYLYFFARKFDPMIDLAVIEKVERMVVVGKATSSPFYWQNDYHHLDRSGSVSSAKLFFLHYAAMRTVEKALPTSCQSRSVHCRPERVLEMTLLRLPSGSVDLLALISGRCSSAEMFTWTIESRFRRSPADPMRLGEHIVHIQVGTKYDLKERLFRDYVGICDSGSKPTLRLKWIDRNNSSILENSSLNVTWYDPSGNAEERQVLSVQRDGPNVQHVSKTTATSRVGTWKVAITNANGSAQIEMAFPVVGTVGNWTSSMDDEAGSMVADTHTLSHVCSQGYLIDQEPTSKLARCLFDLRSSLPHCASTKWSSLAADPTSNFPA
uniref:protein xylosyltransferase n=1 Tax=Trichuris muris TaxID=70415 RepID=A0A5S6R428_TRIMR